MRGRLLAGVAGIVLVVLLLRGRAPAVAVEDYHVAMGTIVRVALFVDESQAPPLFAAARGEIARLDSLLTHYGATSEVARVNEAPVGDWVDVSPELAGLLAGSLRLAERTKGAFDPTLGALTKLWGFPDARRPPTTTQIEAALRLCGHELVQLQGNRVRRELPGLRLDLGAAAKGYIVDRTVALLRAAGVDAGVVEAGGDLRYWGVKPDGRAWRFGVQHPRDPARITAVEDVGLPALATSGDYEQTFEYDGQRYHHLLDPATGRPARRTVSATVWASTAIVADVLATAAFVAGPQAALEWAAADDSVEVLLYYEADGKLTRVTSSGLQGRLVAAADSALASP